MGFFVGHAPSPEHCAVEECIVHSVAVYRPISMRFSAFFHKGLLLQTHYIVLIFVARWRHNFCEIAVKNCEKSKNRRKTLCAPLRIYS